MANRELTFKRRWIEDWLVPAVTWGKQPRKEKTVRALVLGTVTRYSRESAKTGAFLNWKRKVAAKVKADRGAAPWAVGRGYAVSLALRLDLPENHNNNDGDLDNFAKLILDAIAFGLFCPSEVDPLTVKMWKDYDDRSATFSTLFVDRLPDARDEPEGVAIYVSRR